MWHVITLHRFGYGTTWTECISKKEAMHKAKYLRKKLGQWWIVDVCKL